MMGAWLVGLAHWLLRLFVIATVVMSIMPNHPTLAQSLAFSTMGLPDLGAFA
jgi:hypothetical protein